MNKISYTRKCIITNEIVNHELLIRFDYNKSKNEVNLDLDRTLKGRGCYMLLNAENWAKAKKTKALNCAFRTNVSKETYDKIDTIIQEVLNEQEKYKN
ncbi:YlxR family protein [Mycoplasmopsis gallinacea]|nr:YlxR family protein [Mycoplasmopsis gallinacea]